MALKKSSEKRQQEHVNSRQFHIKFNGTAETCPYKTGELYDGRSIIGIGFTTNVYGHSYHLIVERDRTHLRTKFVFDEKHDIKFCKPVEKMVKAPAEVDIQKLLAKAGDGNT
jgi:hypothetical protein|tara:strand:+ start:3127 stop:3462 length:336 start_codon:yes stop_codon:yes gene_type:complete